jgi:hypothetical protein
MRHDKLHRPNLAGHRIDDVDYIGGKTREEFAVAARLCARRGWRGDARDRVGMGSE